MWGDYVVDHYECVVNGLRRDQVTEPACSKEKGHCWHLEGGLSATLALRSDRRERCCWCNTLRVTKPDPDAHGPHDPTRERYRMYA